MGFSLYKLGHFPEAFEYAKQQLAMQHQLYGQKSSSSVADALNNMGICLEHLHRNSEAIDYYEQALKMRREVFQNEAHPQVVEVKEEIERIRKH
jgi:tetratricopeptide (TPR) repeat protein